MAINIEKKKPWKKLESHLDLDKWAELLKDPKIKEEWDKIKKEVKATNDKTK